jgi:hypothetical protein
MNNDEAKRDETMNDSQLMSHITEMVNEEHHLTQLSGQEGGLTQEQRSRIQQIEVHLDQLWDLLRQRRARRDAGQSPTEAHERDTSTVEHYLQ